MFLKMERERLKDNVHTLVAAIPLEKQEIGERKSSGDAGVEEEKGKEEKEEEEK